MEEILHHLGCIKHCKYLDKLPTSPGSGLLPSTVLSDEQMSSQDGHFPYCIASKWATGWGLSTNLFWKSFPVLKNHDVYRLPFSVEIRQPCRRTCSQPGGKTPPLSHLNYVWYVYIPQAHFSRWTSCLKPPARGWQGRCGSLGCLLLKGRAREFTKKTNREFKMSGSYYLFIVSFSTERAYSYKLLRKHTCQILSGGSTYKS